MSAIKKLFRQNIKTFLLTLIAVCAFITSNAQTKTVVGKVVDGETGEALIGVTISVKGTSTGTISDTDGSWSITLDENSTELTFGYIGYETKTIDVGTQSTVQVSLNPTASQLSEVVVIGYGSSSKRDLTGAIATISSDDIVQSPVTGVDQALQGRVAGVTVVQDASPGGAPSVRIRGVGTIGNNNPLYVIDGVPVAGGLNSINPGDIETVSVLKDASATAIYGSRAANGVIIITTKRGGKNAPTQITFSALAGYQQAWSQPDVLNASEYGRVIRASRVNANQQRIANGSSDLLPLTPEFDNPDALVSATNWQDEVFRSGLVQEYKLGVAGGSEKTNYAISTSIRDEEGIILNSSFQRYTARASLDHEISNRLSIGSTIFYSNSNSRGVPNNDIWNGVLQSALTMPEIFPVRDENGQFAAPTGGNAAIYGNAQNPVGQALRSDNSSPVNRVIGNLFVEWEILDNLTFKTLYGTDLSLVSSKFYQPVFLEGSRPNTVASLGQANSTLSWWNWDNTLTYSKVFNEHNVTAIVGTSNQKENLEQFTARREGFPEGDPEGLRFLNFGGQGSDLVSGFGATATLLSYFGRLNYSFKDKYLVTATVRRDGSSRFTEGNRFGTFPSVSVGWRISEEAFLKGSSSLANLKLRASWGEVGNQSVGGGGVGGFYPYVTTVGFNNTLNYTFGGGLATGAAAERLGNQNLSWETTEMKNIGVDIGFFNNRIEISADYFVNDTRDILLQVPLPQLIGQVSSPSVNAGSVRNKGLEVITTYNSKAGKAFNYSVSANASFLNNEVTSLSTAPAIISNNTLRGSAPISRAIVGEPIGSYFGFVTDGIFNSRQEVEAHATQEPNTAAGDIRYKDLNGDGVITSEDRTIIGNGFPDVSYGINFAANYGNFDFSLFFQGVAGVDVFNGLEFLTLNNQGGNKSAKILNYWTPENTNTDIPRLTWDDPNRNSRISDRYVQDASYFRLKTMQIGYTFGQGALKGLDLQSFRVYLSGQNLLTFTDYVGFDPEVTGSDLTIGVDQGIYPQARFFLIGLDVKF